MWWLSARSEPAGGFEPETRANEAIEEATRQMIREAAPGNRLIIGITEDIPQDRWQQNMLAISRVIDEEAAKR